MKRNNFTLIELLVSITIVALLSGMTFGVLEMAQDTSNRSAVTRRMKDLLQVSNNERIFDGYLGYLFYTTGALDPYPYRFYNHKVGTYYYDVPGNWEATSATEYGFWDLPAGIEGFDYVHPFNEAEGYFLFNEVIYYGSAGDNTNGLWWSSSRKIACDVYYYQKEGDNKVSVGFADGHAEVEDTYLEGISGSENYASHMADMYYSSEPGLFGPTP